MEYRPLNMTIISAEGLKDVNRFSKMDVYAEVYIAGYPQSMKKTFVDKNSGPNPKWNQRMEFIVDEPYLTKPGLSLIFHLKSDSTFGNPKEIGTATVPVDELYKPDSTEERIVEYKVITPSGKPKGSVKFSYRFGEKFTHQAAPEVKRHADEPVTAYPAQPIASGSGYAQPHASGSGYAHPGMGYPPPPPPAGYGYGAYPQPGGAYGYQPPPPGYGYPPAGYAPQYGQPQKPKKNKMGMGGGLGLGLGAGLLGGLLVGDMVSDIGDAAAYSDGYGDAMGDMGGFDF